MFNRLTPPSGPVFLISLILAVVAVVSVYYHIPSIGHQVESHRFWILAAAYALLTAGVLLRNF